MVRGGGTDVFDVLSGVCIVSRKASSGPFMSMAGIM